MTPRPPRPRPNIGAIGTYRPGRSAEAAAEHGLAAAVKLASNESPHPPLPSVRAAIEAAATRVNRYPDHLAHALRARLADAIGCEPSRVAIGCGSVGLLQQLALAFAGPGTAVVFGAPSFDAYPIFTQLVAADAVVLPVRRQTLDAAAFAGALDERTRLVLVATPNNPTGTALRTRELLGLADALPDETLLVVDEAYREYVTGADVPDAVALLGGRANVVVLRTFSKAYGLAGLRVGYAIGHPDVVAAIDQTLTPFGVNAIAQAAAAASLDAADELRARVEEVVHERGRVAATLRPAGWMVPDSQANFVWLPAGDRSLELAVELEGHGLVTRPFSGVGVRVTVGTPAENDRFLESFTAAAERLDLASSWRLPSGERARLASSWLERLDAVERRLRRHAAAAPRGLTAPDPGATERWDAGQVWSHLAEFGGYWLEQLDAVVDSAVPGAVPFGRTKRDPARIAAIERHRDRPFAAQLAGVERAIDALRARLCELDVADWAREGRHETLGRMTIDDQLGHFHVGHYEEHAAQLDGLEAAS